MNIQKELNYFRSQLKKHADPSRGEGAKKYLKSPWKFYGVDTPTKRGIVKAWFKNHPDKTVEEIVRLSKKLWDSQWHEEKTLAVMLLHRKSKALSLKQMPLIEKMIKETTGWDHLDEISIRLVGALIDNDPKTTKYLPKWSKSTNFWVRRASLLSQIPQFRRKEGNLKLFFRLAFTMFEEKKEWSKEERFFIRKAIGWTLREIAQKQPEVVYSFIKKHKHQMSGLTYREGSRKLPSHLQAQLKSV